MRVLVVEDDRIIADQIANTLLGEGHQVDVAYDGQTGLKAALGSAYGLVVLDLMLPRTDGFELCAQLRSSRSTVPILMLTARTTIWQSPSMCGNSKLAFGPSFAATRL